MPVNLKQLTSMRFFAAVWVTLYHYWPSLSPTMPGVVAKGYLGVELFFVLSGMNAASRGLLADLPAIGLWTVWASLAKGGSSYIAARVNRFDKQGALLVASLMNCRGVVSLIFLSVGLRNGLISPHTYGVLLVVALVTTLMSTPLIILSVRLTGRSLVAAAEQVVSPALAEV